MDYVWRAKVPLAMTRLLVIIVRPILRQWLVGYIIKATRSKNDRSRILSGSRELLRIIVLGRYFLVESTTIPIVHIRCVVRLMLLCTMLVISKTTHAKNIHLSPEVKLGAYYGVGLQLGLTSMPGLEAVYFSYGRIWSVFIIDDELLQSYRLGIQKMLGSRKMFGFQAELGLATYEGTRKYIGGGQTRRAEGVSIAGAFVYQATPLIGLRVGVELDYFDTKSTYLPYSVTPAWTLGMNFHF